MDKLMAGRTVFVIAHRLSTVRNAKAIIVLDHGEIIERGEHDFLIAQKGHTINYILVHLNWSKFCVVNAVRQYKK